MILEVWFFALPPPLPPRFPGVAVLLHNTTQPNTTLGKLRCGRGHDGEHGDRKPSPVSLRPRAVAARYQKQGKSYLKHMFTQRSVFVGRQWGRDVEDFPVPGYH